MVVESTEPEVARCTSVKALAYDLDLSNLSDEELVVLPVECGYTAATHQLLARLYTTSTRIVAVRARRLHLSGQDTDDAIQNTVFAILRAIKRYDTRRMTSPDSCLFRTFLHRVALDDFKDFVTALWLRNRHYPQFCEGDRRAGDCAIENNGSSD